MNRRMALWAWAWGLLGAALAHAQDAKTEVPAVIRIGVATGGVGNPVRHGGSTTALAYTDNVIEEEFRKDGTKVEWIFSGTHWAVAPSVHSAAWGVDISIFV